MRFFEKIKPSRNGKITLLFTDVVKSCPICDFNVANMSFNAIRENKILGKIYSNSKNEDILFSTKNALLIITDFLAMIYKN